MFKFLRVPPSLVDRLDKAPIPINDRINNRIFERRAIDDRPSLVRDLAKYCQIPTHVAEVAILNYYGRTADGPLIFVDPVTSREPTTCRESIHRLIKEWLRDFAWDANHKNPVQLANTLCMSGFGAPYTPEEINDYDNLWINAHRRLYDRALIKILRNARKWSAVRKVLVANKDRHGREIYDQEWHPKLLESLALYEKRPARKRKAKAT